MIEKVLMALVLVARAEMVPTVETVLDGPNISESLSCVFEDDGVTGYFYALESAIDGSAIEDAVQVYQYTEGNPTKSAYRLEILWNDAGDLCVLSLDGHLYAMFDFKERVGYNKTGFPEPTRESDWRRNGSTEVAMEILRERM